MQFTLHLSPKDLHLDRATVEHIQDKAAKLATFYPRILKCRVVLEGPVHHHRKGGPYIARIDLTVPGAELVVNHHATTDLRQAIRETFEAARRRLEDYGQYRRGEVKKHQPSSQRPGETGSPGLQDL